MPGRRARGTPGGFRLLQSVIGGGNVGHAPEIAIDKGIHWRGRDPREGGQIMHLPGTQRFLYLGNFFTSGCSGNYAARQACKEAPRRSR